MTTAHLNEKELSEPAQSYTQVPPSEDQRGYRSALGRFGTGVCLVSVRDEEGIAHAITVNSFTSVSLTPPMVLWCLDDRSSQFERFSKADAFAISILAADQRALSDQFARPGRPVLDPSNYDLDRHGVPLVRNSLARLSCQVAWREIAGDHLVIFAHVLGFDRPCEQDGLGYFAGSYVVNTKPIA
jgi:flavin reductase (DIM6/NTAB) family NADH-FMN oxidoreductase RutF